MFFSGARAQNADKMQLVHDMSLTCLLRCYSTSHETYMSAATKKHVRMPHRCQRVALGQQIVLGCHWNCGKPLAESNSPAINPSKKPSEQFGRFWDCDSQQTHFRFSITFYYLLEVTCCAFNVIISSEGERTRDRPLARCRWFALLTALIPECNIALMPIQRSMHHELFEN